MPDRRNIFVLSGGGSRGAGQVGMLRTLWGAGITPDVMIGGSVGAINCCFVGSHPTADGIEDLARHWLRMSEPLLCGSRRDAVLNVARRRPYLYSSERLRKLAASWCPTYHLENLAVPVIVATTDIATGRAVHHESGYIPDLLAASAALPGLFPPVTMRGPDGPVTHVDAGIAENVPLTAALRIATPGDRVFVLDVTRMPQTTRVLRNPLDVIIASLVAAVRNREEPVFAPGVDLVRCKLDEAYDCGSVFDFSHTATLFRLGEEAAETALRAAVPTVDPLVA